jgi:hypothetical protein
MVVAVEGKFTPFALMQISVHIQANSDEAMVVPVRAGKLQHTPRLLGTWLTPRPAMAVVATRAVAATPVAVVTREVVVAATAEVRVSYDLYFWNKSPC